MKNSRATDLKELDNMARASVHGAFFLFLGMTSSTLIMALTSILVDRLIGLRALSKKNPFKIYINNIRVSTRALNFYLPE